MTRPSSPAVVLTAVFASEAAICARLGQYQGAAILACLGVAAAAVFWHYPWWRDDDIEAIVKATRETIPDYVPADWTEEHT